MKRLIFIILIFSVFLRFNINGQVYTPTNVSVATLAGEYFPPDTIVKYDSVWAEIIITNEWDAKIIGSVDGYYNCHGYAWHVSDGGNKVRILTANPYILGEYPSYELTTRKDTLEKVKYLGDNHSAITTYDPDYVISKWGNGPLVRHKIYDCPYDSATDVEYYRLKMDGDTSIPKNTAVDVTTLQITGATYNWSGDEYVCASGNYVGTVWGLNVTGNDSGRVIVAITSPYSNTTIKGSKYYFIGSAPTPLPSISSGGIRLVCSTPGVNFTLNNLPDGTTITWSSSSNLSTSNNTTNPCTFHWTGGWGASGWVQATLSCPCESELDTIIYPVWAGPPALNVSGPEEGYTYNTYTFYANPGTYSNPTSYDPWILSPLLGNHVYDYDYYCRIAFYDPDYYQVVTRAINTCGTGEYSDWEISIEDDYGEKYSLSPNPASEIVTVTVKKTVATDDGSIEVTNDNDINAIYTISIFDYYGILYYSVTESGNSFTFPVSNLKDGNYVVQINDGKKISNLKLVIRH